MGIKKHKYILFFSLMVAVFTAARAQSPDWTLRTPELGGTLRLGIEVDGNSKWFNQLEQIKTKDNDEEIVFILQDALLGKAAKIEFTIRPLNDSKGAVMQLKGAKLPEHARIIWTYGGASNSPIENRLVKRQITPDDCYQNVFSIEGNAFTLYYGNSRKLKILEALAPPGEKLKLGDAHQQKSPATLLNSGKKTDAQVVTSSFHIENDEAYYFCFYFLNPAADYNYFMLPKLFEEGSYKVNKETEWMKSTPD